MGNRNKFTLSVPCLTDADKQALNDLFAKSTSLEVAGFILEQRASPLGFASPAASVELNVSFKPGMPASVSAMWLWEHIAQQGRRKVFNGRATLKSFEDWRRWVLDVNPYANQIADVGQALHLHRLRIAQFRNLRDVEFHFQPYPTGEKGENCRRKFRSYAVIGQNGTGKSNLFEAMITLFKEIDLDKDASFDYELDYSIRGHYVQLQANLSRQRRPFVWVDGIARSQSYLLANKE